MIEHARVALFMQQMKANVVVFDGRIEFDWDGDEVEGETPREMGRAIVRAYHGAGGSTMGSG